MRRDRAHSRPAPLRRVAAAAAAAPAFARTLLVLFFLSGAVALVYQSLWMRQLSLVLGSTTYAVGTVLAAFMAGLGVGADVLGRRADRTASPLRLYALLEAAIGLAGLASPAILAQGSGLYAAVYAELHDTPGLLTFVRFLIGFGFVALPAFLMGGTLPVAARHLVRREHEVGRHVALLYALNTLGAALGALALPYLLLPALGMRASLLASGATNLGIAAVAWAASQRVPPAAPPPGAPPARAAAPGGRGLLAAFFLSGFVALGLEVTWNRFFSMYVGSSIYSYALILFLYLGGLVLGGLLYPRLDRRGLDPARVFAAALLLLLAVLALTAPLMDRVLYVQVATLSALGTSFAGFQLASLAIVALVVLPPTVLFGVSFPAVAAALARDPARVGGRLGRAYLVNTAGTTAGALAATFVFLPALGVRGSIDLLAALLLPALVLAAPSPRRVLGLAPAAALAAAPALLPAWDARLMHTNLSKEPEHIVGLWRDGTLAEGVRGVTVRELRDGVDATASVARYGDMLALLVNGKVDATDGADMAMQTMLGHLPLLVHPAARDVLVIGMGSGVTLAAVARHPAAAIDLVEISAEVLDLGDRHFRHVNRGALHDPRVTAHVEDGRNFVAFNTARAYDVVVSEPSNPWMTGVANLFTDEFFAGVRRRLRPEGVLAQWFHFYAMRLDHLRSLVATVHRHFPHVYGFAFHHREELTGDLLLLAAGAPLDFAPVLAGLRSGGRAAEDLGRFGFTEAEPFLQGLVLSPDVLGPFVAGAPVNSDDRPRIELDAPRALFRYTTLENLEALVAAGEGARLPVGTVDGEPGLALAGDGGVRRVAAAYRLEPGLQPNAPGRPSRTPVLEQVFTDGAARRVTALAARGVRDGIGLARLAATAAGAPVGAGDADAVRGHPALAYAGRDGRVAVLAWACPHAGASYAAAGPPEVARRLRCHDEE